MFKKIILSLILCFCVIISSCSVFVFADNSDGDISLSAVSAAAYSPLTGSTVYEKNCHERLPMASTTKIMTALIVCERLNLDSLITITKEDSLTEGSSSGLKAGDTVSVGDLIYCMLLPSGNDAANAGARAVSGGAEAFSVLMNEKARELKMNDTNFVTPSGLDAPGHYSSAYDLALLAAEALKNDFLKEVFSSVSHTVETKQGIKYYLTNHNRLLKSIDGCCGVKTGFTKKSGRCLVSATTRDSLSLIAVTLNAPDDWSDHKKMIDRAFSSVCSLRLNTAKANIPVTGSSVREITASSDIPEIKTFGDISGEISVRITSDKFLYAPVDETTPCASADILYKNRIIYSVTLHSEAPAGVKIYEEKKQTKKSLIEKIKVKFRKIMR